MELIEFVPISGISKPSNLTATAWVRENFGIQQLHSPMPSKKPFNGLDKIVLLSWILEQFSGADRQPFVLHYWDLRMPNIMIDDDYNIIA